MKLSYLFFQSKPIISETNGIFVELKKECTQVRNGRAFQKKHNPTINLVELIVMLKVVILRGSFVTAVACIKKKQKQGISQANATINHPRCS